MKILEVGFVVGAVGAAVLWGSVLISDSRDDRGLDAVAVTELAHREAIDAVRGLATKGEVRDTIAEAAASTLGASQYYALCLVVSEKQFQFDMTYGPVAGAADRAKTRRAGCDEVTLQMLTRDVPATVPSTHQ